MNTKEFETTGIEVVAWLQATGYEFTRIERRGRTVVFVYPAEAREAAAKFHNSRDGQLAHRMLRAYRIIRGIVLDSNREAAA